MLTLPQVNKNPYSISHVNIIITVFIDYISQSKWFNIPRVEILSMSYRCFELKRTKLLMKSLLSNFPLGTHQDHIMKHIQ